MGYRPSHRQLEYLVAVAEHGHFGQAARACHVSQSTLSAQLRLLEDQLGTTLIDRGTSPVLPTPAGQAILLHARSVLVTLDEIVRQARASETGLGGLIRLGVAPTIGPYLMPAILEDLQSSFPGQELYIREDRPSALEADVRDGSLDCILTPSGLREARLVKELICEEGVYLGVPARHRLAGLAEVCMQDLAGERMLTLGRGHRLYDDVQALCSASGAAMSEDYEGTSLDALRQMVSIGMGLSLFPAAYVATEFARERLVHLKVIKEWPMRRHVVLAWREGTPRLQHFLRLADYARDALRRRDCDGVSIVGTGQRPG